MKVAPNVIHNSERYADLFLRERLTLTQARSEVCAERIAASQAADAARDQHSKLREAQRKVEHQITGWSSSPALHMLEKAAAAAEGEEEEEGWGGQRRSRSRRRKEGGAAAARELCFGGNSLPGGDKGARGDQCVRERSPGMRSLMQTAGGGGGGGSYAGVGSSGGNYMLSYSPGCGSPSAYGGGCYSSSPTRPGLHQLQHQQQQLSPGRFSDGSPVIRGKRGVGGGGRNSRGTAAGLRELLRELAGGGSSSSGGGSPQGLYQSERGVSTEVWGDWIWG